MISCWDFTLNDLKTFIVPIYSHLFLAEDHSLGTVECHHLDCLAIPRHHACNECLATAVGHLSSGPAIQGDETQYYGTQYLNKQEEGQFLLEI